MRKSPNSFHCCLAVTKCLTDFSGASFYRFHSADDCAKHQIFCVMAIRLRHFRNSCLAFTLQAWRLLETPACSLMLQSATTTVTCNLNGIIAVLIVQYCCFESHSNIGLANTSILQLEFAET